MANITNFTFQGAVNGGGFGWSSYSFRPPSDAWAFQITVTGPSGYSETLIQSFTDDSHRSPDVSFDYQGTAVVKGAPYNVIATYTASITFSTVVPPGTPVFSSTPVTTTFVLNDSTAQLMMDPNYYTDIKYFSVFYSCWPSYSGTGTIRIQGANGVDITDDLVMPDDRITVKDWGNGVVQPGVLYTITLTVSAHAFPIVRTFYGPLGVNTFGTPTIGPTSVTLPWTDAIGSGVSASNAFTTCALYNQDTDAWIEIKKVAIGTQTYTKTGLDNNTSYQLYCWPMNSSGFEGQNTGDHSITFVTGGTATSANFGINGWFYSPVGN